MANFKEVIGQCNVKKGYFKMNKKIQKNGGYNKSALKIPFIFYETETRLLKVFYFKD